MKNNCINQVLDTLECEVRSLFVKKKTKKKKCCKDCGKEMDCCHECKPCRFKDCTVCDSGRCRDSCEEDLKPCSCENDCDM